MAEDCNRMIGEKIPVLDRGFVRLVDIMGDDSAIVQAARVSYANGTKTTRTDRALIRYMMRNHHGSPFEMCEIKLEVKLPIFVARQFIRHRTFNVNEMSARYSELPEEYYVPSLDRVQGQSKTNKQGSGDALDVETAEMACDLMRGSGVETFGDYRSLLGADVARELARCVLPVSTYTQWFWKVDLRNLLHFLELRLHPHAQYEARVYAEVIADIVKAWVPLTWEAFVDYRLEAATLSKQELGLLRKMAAFDELEVREMARQAGMTKREIDNFIGVLI